MSLIYCQMIETYLNWSVTGQPPWTVTLNNGSNIAVSTVSTDRPSLIGVSTTDAPKIDQQTTRSYECEPSDFKCISQPHICIVPALLCDGIRDCPDNSDEFNCPAITNRSKSTRNFRQRRGKLNRGKRKRRRRHGRHYNSSSAAPNRSDSLISRRSTVVPQEIGWFTTRKLLLYYVFNSIFINFKPPQHFLADTSTITICFSYYFTWSFYFTLCLRTISPSSLALKISVTNYSSNCLPFSIKLLLLVTSLNVATRRS